MEHADKRLHVGNVIHFTRLGNIARSHKDVIRQERCFTASEMVLLQEKPSAIVSQYIETQGQSPNMSLGSLCLDSALTVGDEYILLNSYQLTLH